MLKITFWREGPANNSSSSHSIIFTKKKLNTDEYLEFGWDFFTAADKEAKLNYAILCLYSTWRGHNHLGYDTKNISYDTIEKINNDSNIKKHLSRFGDIKITVQTILEVISYEDFKEFIWYCGNQGYPVTLLGYKDFGFGKGNKPFNYTKDWIRFMKDTVHVGFGVDSQIVKDWREDLLELGVEDYRLVGEEGQSTCFVDLQKQVMKPSSFTEQKFELKPTREHFYQTYHKF